MPKAEARLQVLQVCKLLQCVRERDKQQIEKLITLGTPNLVNYNAAEEGLTALTVAAKANDDEILEFLLKHGAHPDVKDFNGKTPAMWAAEFGNVECLKKLLGAHASLKLTDAEGKGILFYLMTPTERHAICLELALGNDADVNNIDNDGNHVLAFACDLAEDNEKFCLQLLKQGADPNGFIKKSGRTALMAAAASGGIKVVAALLEAGAHVNSRDNKKYTASHLAALNGHLHALMLIAGYGPDFNLLANDGGNPIHHAAAKGNALCIRFLAQRGCNPKIKNNLLKLPRVLAKEGGYKEAGKEVRKAERIFGKTGKNNDPCIIQLYDWVQARKDMIISSCKAADMDDVGKVKINEFVDIMAALQCPTEETDLRTVLTLQDKNRENVIDYADFLLAKKWVNKNFLVTTYDKKKKGKKKGRRGGKKGKFKLIMPICVQDEGPRTFGGAPPEVYIPRHIHFTDAGRFDRDKPPKHPLQDDSAWYVDAPSKTYVNMIEAAKDGDLDSIQDALSRGISIDTRDKFYKTPLMIACATGNIKVVKYLLDKGAAVNAKDNFKWTPLHHACHAGQLDVVQLLVQNGAEIDVPTINGGTPLTRAIESSREAIVQFLIEKGCKMRTENKNGLSPMDLAYAWADARVFEIVKTKWDSLPVPKDQKKKAKKKPDKKKQAAGANAADGAVQVKKLPEESLVPLPRRGSILQAASALAGDQAQEEEICYTPRKAWTKQPTTRELIRDREIRRERFGWEVDFPDFQMPFENNIIEKIKLSEMLEEA